jgi:hypothetical protein
MARVELEATRERSDCTKRRLSAATAPETSSLRPHGPVGFASPGLDLTKDQDEG